MEEKKSPKKLEWSPVACQNTSKTAAPSRPPPPSHQTYNNEKPSRTRRNFCERLFKKDEILREGHFARKGFCEKNILRERNFERKIFWEKNPIDWFSKSLNKNWSIREWSDWPNSPSQKTIYFSSSDLISCAYVRARAQISWICKFGRVLRYVHCTDWYKIYLLKKIRCILSKFYNK